MTRRPISSSSTRRSRDQPSLVTHRIEILVWLGMDGVVLVERDEGLHRLTLNRPDKINALNDAVFLALGVALDAAEADASCQAIVLMKRAFEGAPTLEAQLLLERDLQRRARRTPDFREGVAAFRDKRPARFTGLP